MTYQASQHACLVNISEYEQILRSGQLEHLPELDRWYWGKVTIIDDDRSCWEFREARRKRHAADYGTVSMVNPATPHERRKSGGKLTQPQIDEIRRLRMEHVSITELGRRFGVHHSNISVVCRDLPKVRAPRGHHY